MNAWLCILALALAAVSASALYAASPHCMWAAWRRRQRVARMLGIALAIASLLIWICALGAAVGLCAMLASWMLGLIVQPYLALLAGTPAADPSTAEND